MLPPRDPGDVVRAVAAGVSRLVGTNLTPDEREGQLDALAGLYGERADVRHPLAPLGDHPLRTRAELREHFAGAIDRTSGVRRFEPTDMTVHRTADPELVVFEFTYSGTVERGEFALPCVLVARVRDGLIIESRDYGDHIGLARAFGRLGSLARALAASGDHAPGHPTGLQHSRDLALRMHQAFNTLDLQAVDEIFAADFYSHPLRSRGPGAVKQRWATMRAAAPDLRTEVIDVIAEDDRAMVRSRLNDNTGELIEVIRVADGQIAEVWGARTGSGEPARADRTHE